MMVFLKSRRKGFENHSRNYPFNKMWEQTVLLPGKGQTIFLKSMQPVAIQNAVRSDSKFNEG
jgi:hypothetical protein